MHLSSVRPASKTMNLFVLADAFSLEVDRLAVETDTYEPEIAT